VRWRGVCKPATPSCWLPDHATFLNRVARGPRVTVDSGVPGVARGADADVHWVGVRAGSCRSECRVDPVPSLVRHRQVVLRPGALWRNCALY
jgi:hypothetical protein